MIGPNTPEDSRNRPPAPLGGPQSDLTPVPPPVLATSPRPPQKAAQPIFEDTSSKRKTPVSSFTLFLVFALLIAGLFYLHYQAETNPSSHTLDPLSQIIPKPTNSSAPIQEAGTDTATPPPSEAGIGPIAPGVTEDALLQKIGGPRLNIVYSSDPEYNCGIAQADSTKLQDYATGCYTQKYEDTIFIYYGSQSSYAMRYFVLLHEYGHYQQGQIGFLQSKHWNRADAEADADCRAVYLGASQTIRTCTIPNWNPDFLKNKYAL